MVINITAIQNGQVSYDELRDFVSKAWNAYFQGKPIISDHDYDNMTQAIMSNIKYVPIMKEFIGTEPVDEKSGHEIVNHRFPQLRGTLGNVHKIRKEDESSSKTHKSMEEWVNTLPRKVRLHASLKVDGISSVIELESNKTFKAIKRGDTSRNKAQTIPIIDSCRPESMYQVFSNMYANILTSNDYYPFPYSEESFPHGLKVEVYMTKERFREVEHELDVDNHLSATSSLVNKLNPNPDHLFYLSIYPISCVYNGRVYNMLASRDVNNVDVNDLSWWNPQNNLYVDSDDFLGMKKIIRIYKAISEKYGIPADGVVFAAVDDDVREAVGRSNNINLYEIAYKFPLEVVEATIKDIDMSVGSYGGITPVVKIHPVRTGGVEVRSITVGSIDRFKQLNLGIGDTVGISRGVVPYLHYVIEHKHKEPYPIPDQCPTCLDLLEHSDTGELTCRNLNCPSRVVGVIESHCKRMDIPGLSDKTIELLVNKGFLSDILSLYFLEQYQYRMKLLPGFGEKSVSSILYSIKNASLQPVKDYVLFGALGIKTIGERKFKPILEKYTPLTLIDNYERLPEMLEGIQGCGKETIDILTRWFSHEHNRTLALGLTFVYVNLQITSEMNNEDKLTFLFTGVRNKELSKLIERKGHEVAKSYSKNVDYVIIPNKEYTSGKTEDAIRDGKKVIVIDEVESVL